MCIIYLPLNIRHLLDTGLVRDSAIWPEKKYRPTKVIILTQKIDKEFTSVGFHETVSYKNSFIYVKFLTETIYQQKLIYRTGAQRLS